jgi:DNA-binding transcriptional LysR family regulator
MRVEWIDDILAVLDGGSLAHAAKKRLLTQSAFTRRVRTIEDSIGATLFDRSRKPVSLMPGVQALEPELRELSTLLHKMRHTLKTSSDQDGKPLAFVCQHALSATVSPQIVRAVTERLDVSVRLRSGNKDECLMQLLSRDVEFAIMYALPGESTPDTNKAFESVKLGEDILIPVCAPAMRKQANTALLPIVAYPPDVFLGQVFARLVAPRLPKGATVAPIAETALTLAMLQLTLNGIGISWLPYSLIIPPLEQGHLVRLDTKLPTQSLDVRITRLRDVQTKHSEAIWHDLTENQAIFKVW